MKQTYSPAPEVRQLMDSFRGMVNDSIRIGLQTGVTSMKKLCSLSYHLLRSRYKSISSRFYLTAISRAAGILSSRKKSLRREIKTKDPYVRRHILVSCYDFKIKENSLVFSLSNKRKIRIQLSRYTLKVIKSLEVRSFTLTPNSLSLSVRKIVEPYIPKSFLGIDRNASNITCGNQNSVLQFNLAKVEQIARTTRQIVRSFKRNDARIRKLIASKYGGRRSERIKQILHHVSKKIVEQAKQNRSAIVFEDIRGIRNLYKKGNCQGKSFRGRMNSVPWSEIKRQIEYKAAWVGVPVIELTKGETRGTSKLCPVCGERLQEDRNHKRQLWCEKCRKWEDRDVVAVMNISYRGWLRFRQSKGEASEAMVQERGGSEVPLILKVDASKLTSIAVMDPKS